MEPEDSFFNKLHEIFDTPSIIGKRDRFNLREDERDRTLGVLLVGLILLGRGFRSKMSKVLTKMK